MAFPAKKKPDMTLILGIGRKPKPSAPPPFGGTETPEEEAAEPPSAEPDGDESSTGSLTPEMMHYSGPEEHCAMCSHFTAPTTCDRWADPVDEGGHCSGFQGADTGDQMQASDMMPAEEEMPA